MVDLVSTGCQYGAVADVAVDIYKLLTGHSRRKRQFFIGDQLFAFAQPGAEYEDDGAGLRGFINNVTANPYGYI